MPAPSDSFFDREVTLVARDLLGAELDTRKNRVDEPGDAVMAG